MPKKAGGSTKRAVKFNKKGGIKAALKAGSVTKKGKLRKRRDDDKKDNKSAPAAPEEDDSTRNGYKRTGASGANGNQGGANEVTTATPLEQMDLDQFMSNDFDNSDLEDAFAASDDDEENVESDSDSDSAGGDDGSDGSDADADADAGSPADDSDSDSSSEELSEELHKQQMQKLAKKDPEFHKFLMENNKDLLEFGEDESDSDGDDADEDEDEDEDEELPAPTPDPSPTPTPDDSSNSLIVTISFLKSLEKKVFSPTNPSLKALRKYISIFNSATHMGDVDSEKETRYIINDPQVLNRIIVFGLNRLSDTFQTHFLPPPSPTTPVYDEHTPIKESVLKKSKSWKTGQPILKSFYKATLHFLTITKEPTTHIHVLKSLPRYVPMLTPFPRLAAAFLKTLTKSWSSSTSASAAANAVRLNSFLLIRQLSLTQPFPFIETALKSVYLAYAKSSKFVNENTLPNLTFMGNCIVELYSLDVEASYQHAFIYVRQLALHLRAGITKKTREAFAQVYNWQYMNCLKVWVAVVASNCGTGELRELVYPLTEIIMGVLKLVPTSLHLPLRLMCVRLLQQLASKAEVFIPTASLLMDMLDVSELHKKPRKESGGKSASADNVEPITLALMLKFPKEKILVTSNQQEAVASEIFLLLNRDIDLYRYSVGFPEYSVRIVQKLKSFQKVTKVKRWGVFAKGCVEMCGEYKNWVTLERSKIEQAPKDILRLEHLKPKGKEGMGDRLASAISQEKRLEEMAKPVVSKAEKKKRDEERARVEEGKKRKREAEEDKKVKKKKRKEKYVEEGGSDDDLEDMEDDVEEGVDWGEED